MAITATVKECCDAVHNSLGLALVASGVLVRSQNAASDQLVNDGLTEGMNDPDTLQVYPRRRPLVSVGSGTTKITLTGNKDKELVIFADYYAKRRGHIAEDMALVIKGVDAIEANLDAQDCPYFGLEKIRGFQYEWEQITFIYGELESSQLKYPGARFTLTLRTY